MTDNWIDIHVKAPDFGVPVFVCTQGDNTSVNICRLDGKTERKEYTSFEWLEGTSGYDSYYLNVTHWQHLPICKATEIEPAKP